MRESLNTLPFGLARQRLNGDWFCGGGEQIPSCHFDRWKQNFTPQQSKIPMTTIVRRYKHLGLNINVLDHFTWGGSYRLSSMNLG